MSNRFDTDPGAGGTEVLTADLAEALADRCIQVTWMAATAAASRSLPPPGANLAAQSVRRLRVPIPAALAPPVGWQVREQTAATAITTALRSLPPIDLVHLTHFSRSGLEFLDQAPVREAAVVATLTDYTAVCGDYQLICRPAGQRCEPPVTAEMCTTCLTSRTTSQVSRRDVETWRRRNLVVFNGRCQALWMQTPYQRRQLRAAGVRDDHVVDDRAAYAIPSAWRPHRPVGGPPTLLFLGRASAEKGLHVLLDAFTAWRRQARLVLCSTPDDAGYERQARRVAAADPRIEWRTPVARDDLAELLNDADALVVPSQWDENHPMVLQYALALGVPLLCSGVASLEHLAAEPGLYFVDRYRDPAAWVEEFEHLVGQMPDSAADRGVELRRRYDEHVDATVQIYRRLAGVA